MSLPKIILLLTLVYLSFAANSTTNGDLSLGQTQKNITHNDDKGHEHVDKIQANDTHSLKPATSFSSGKGRKVIWRGPASYPGYDRYVRRNQVKKVTSSPRTHAAPSHSRRGRTQITIPLYNKKRANDKKYFEGLRELADLS
nr:hypothetical transcript [Hymenolepis microstoma]